MHTLNSFFGLDSSSFRFFLLEKSPFFRTFGLHLISKCCKHSGTKFIVWWMLDTIKSYLNERLLRTKCCDYVFAKSRLQTGYFARVKLQWNLNHVSDIQIEVILLVWDCCWWNCAAFRIVDGRGLKNQAMRMHLKVPHCVLLSKQEDVKRFRTTRNTS